MFLITNRFHVLILLVLYLSVSKNTEKATKLDKIKNSKGRKKKKNIKEEIKIKKHVR